MAAMANALGNRSLFYSKYESYKKVKYTEKKYIAYILKALAKKARSKEAERNQYLLESVDRIANPLWQYLNMSLALKTWKRYLKIYDSVEKDEVDIDSGDFELSELEDKEELERKKNQTKIGVASTLKQIASGARRGSRLSRNSKNSMNSKDVRNPRRKSTLLSKNKVGHASRDQSRKPTVLHGVPIAGSQKAIDQLNEAMDNLDRKEILTHEETMRNIIQADEDKEPRDKTYK